MRKHNKTFAQRWNRDPADRSNFPQVMAHSFANNKVAQLGVNSLLMALLRVVGVKVPGSWIRKTV